MSKTLPTILILYLLCSFNFIMSSRITILKDRNSLHISDKSEKAFSQYDLNNQETHMNSLASITENQESLIETSRNSISISSDNAYASFVALKNTIEMEIENNKKNRANKFGEIVKDMAGYVSQSISRAVPYMFCWKEGGDFGRIPTDCPSGMFRFLALCYEKCIDGYDFLLGVCWQRCPSGTTDIGAICTGYGFKSSYIARSVTNFDSSVKCPGDLYKGGALCYRDCKTISMVNCGIGACARSSVDCASAIITMIVDVLLGLVDMVMFALSFGSSTALTTLKSKLKDVAKGGISAAIKSMKSYIKQIGNSAFREKVIQLAKSKAKEQLGVAVSTAISDATITKLADLALEKEEQRNLAIFNQDWFITNLDPLQIQYAVDNCKAAGDSVNDGITCASAVCNTLAKIDPTGIASIASAFAKPICNVPESISAEQKAKNKEIEDLIKKHQEAEKVKEKAQYVKIFTGENFTGSSKEYSELVSDDNLITLDGTFTNKIKSMIVGRHCDIALCGTKDGSDDCVPIPVGSHANLDKLLGTSNQRLQHNKISLAYSQGAFIFWQTDFKGKKQYVANDTSFLGNPFQSCRLTTRNTIYVYTQKASRLFGGDYATGIYNLKNKYSFENPQQLNAKEIYQIDFGYHAKPNCLMLAKKASYGGSKTQLCRNMKLDKTNYNNSVNSLKVSSELNVSLVSVSTNPNDYFELISGGTEISLLSTQLSGKITYAAPNGDKCVVIYSETDYKGSSYWTCRSRSLSDIKFSKIGSIKLAFEGSSQQYDFFLDSLPNGNGISHQINKSIPNFNLPLDKLTNAVLRIVDTRTGKEINTEEDGEIY